MAEPLFPVEVDLTADNPLAEAFRYAMNKARLDHLPEHPHIVAGCDWCDGRLAIEAANRKMAQA